jgi:alkylation response protein AidB-like acyl-CoA dehydrogenase
MNFALSDEQELLREAARGALSRVKTLEAARAALEGEPLPDLWPAACEAGWPGLLISEEHDGAGLGPIDAMLVFAELGRALASVPLLGHLPATFVLERAGADRDLLAELAAGSKRAAFVPARPAGDVEERWTVEARTGFSRPEAPRAGEGGEVAWVPDAPGADVLVVACADGRAMLVDTFEVEPVLRYDATRSLGHVRFEAGEVLDAPPQAVANAWYLASTLLAAESLGAVEQALELSVAYAKERFTFGRAIGSYQAVKHQLVEILRRLDNARSLMYYAGWAGADRPDEFPLAASAFRLSAGKAFEDASRTQISVHGGIGATWEHDAPLYFRRAQLSRRLLGGTAGAADRVAGELFSQAKATA